MKLNLFKIVGRQHLCCLLFFIISCNSPSTNNNPTLSAIDSLSELKKEKEIFDKIADLKKSVQNGDLILRTGRDFTSDIMRRVSKSDTTYSHCGIASWENDTLFVYHALGGEWNPDQKIRRDTFGFFCNPYENRGIGIFRYNINTSGKFKLVNAAQKYAAHVLFDNKFDLSSDDRMYCSEYVYKCLKLATGDSPDLPTSTFNQTNYVAIDDLFNNSITKEIIRVKY